MIVIIKAFTGYNKFIVLMVHVYFPHPHCHVNINHYVILQFQVHLYKVTNPTKKNLKNTFLIIRMQMPFKLFYNFFARFKNIFTSRDH